MKWYHRNGGNSLPKFTKPFTSGNILACANMIIDKAKWEYSQTCTFLHLNSIMQLSSWQIEFGTKLSCYLLPNVSAQKA